jgi:hypothetical protein
MPAFLYWLFGSLAAGMTLVYFWPYDHSSGSLVFYGVVVVGIVLGLVHRTVIRRRAMATEPPPRGAHDV